MHPNLPIIGRFLDLLTEQERWKLVVIAGIVLLTAAVEIAAIASLFPFLGAAAQPEAIASHPVLSRMHQTLGEPEPRRLLLILGGITFSAVVAANLLRLVTLWVNYRFAWGVQHALSNRLLTGYAALPLRDWLSRRPADTHTRVVAEVNNTTVTFIIPLLDLTMHGTAVLAITALIVLLDPILALLIAGILGGAYAGLYLSIRRLLRRIGARRLARNLERFQYARELLMGLKDMRLERAERPLLERFHRASGHYSRTESLRMTLALSPKYALELVAIGSILIVTLYLLARSDSFAEIVPTLGLYAFAGYRLMPRMQGMFQALTNMRVNRETLDQLVAEMRALRANPEPVLEDLPALEPPQESIGLEKVRVRYPGAESEALAGLTLEIPVNTTVGIVGSSGAGKSTAVDVLLGLLAPDDGALVVDGVPLDLRGRVAWRSHVGHVPQQIFLSDDTVAANIAFGVPPDAVDQEAMERAARLAHLHTFVTTELPDGYNTLIGENGMRLSGGQRQRIGIARALYRDPTVLVFDEATSALDNLTEREIMAAIRGLAGSRTIVMVAHRLSTVQACDRIYVLDRGTLEAEGPWEQVAESSRVLRELIAAAEGSGETGSPSA